MAASAPGVPATVSPAGPTRAIGRDLGRVTIVVVAVGRVLTALLTWAAAQAFDSSEDRLLRQQAEEAAAVLQQAVPAVTGQAQEAARVAALLVDDPTALERELATDIGEGRRFAAITVTRDGEPLASVGEREMGPDELARAAEAATDAAAEQQVHVSSLLDGPDRRLSYSAAADGPGGIVAHAEQPLAPDPVDTEREGTAFEGIDLALYLGEEGGELLLSTTPDLPIDGRRTERTIALGDQDMRLVVSPAGTLGGGLIRVFPWLTAGAGLLSTLIGGVLIESLHRRRRDAEAFTTELHALYRREHAIAHTLQHSLLPTHLDRLVGIEVAARYFPGAEGTEIGGDWYDVIQQDGAFTVVVGDVVGRGVQAAAVMAAMRYGSHAVAGQVSDPSEVLQAVNGLEHIRGDFVTMLCGSVDATAGEVRFASAGHPAPLLVADGRASFLDVRSGPPIGFLETCEYESTATAVPSGAVLVLFTDGLYERRGEDISVGLERLRTAAAGLTGSVDDVLDGIAAAMLGDGVRDDTAMLALRMP